jgi:hypothetical protein
MRYLLTRLGSFAGLLAISGAALADAACSDAALDGAINCLPEPGVLELVAIAAVVGWVLARKRGGK